MATKTATILLRIGKCLKELAKSFRVPPKGDDTENYEYNRCLKFFHDKSIFGLGNMFYYFNRSKTIPNVFGKCCFRRIHIHCAFCTRSVYKVDDETEHKKKLIRLWLEVKELG